MISFTFGWDQRAESSSQAVPGHDNTGTADWTGTPGPAGMATVGQAGGEAAETHQVDSEHGEEWRDPFVGITNGTIEEDDINSTDTEDSIESRATEEPGFSLYPDHGHEAVGVTDVDETALRAEEQAPPRARRRTRARVRVSQRWRCLPGHRPCRRCITADRRRRERGQNYLLERNIILTVETMNLDLDLD